MERQGPLSKSERDELEALMTARNPDGIHGGSIVWLHGMLTAVLSGPLVPPSQWIPFALGASADPGWENIDQAQRAMGLLMRFYNEVNDRLRSIDRFAIMIDRIGDPPDAVDYADNWCRGYADWMSAHVEDWERATESAEITAAFTPILDLAQGESGIDPVLEPKAYRKLVNAVPIAALEIYVWWQAQLEKPSRGETVRHTAPRTAPNEPCPCGSGKKYKRCCSPLRN